MGICLRGSGFLVGKPEGKRRQEQGRKTFFLSKSFSLVNLPLEDLQFTFQKCALRHKVFRSLRRAAKETLSPGPLRFFEKNRVKLFMPRGSKCKFLCCYLANLEADTVRRGIASAKFDAATSRIWKRGLLRYYNTNRKKLQQLPKTVANRSQTAPIPYRTI